MPKPARLRASVLPIGPAIAVPGNPLEDVALMKYIDFVMQEGIVYKQGGRPTPVSLQSTLEM